MNLQMPPQSSLPKAHPQTTFPGPTLTFAQIRGQLLREWQVWHIPRDDFPFSPTTNPPATFTLSRHAVTRLFQMKLVASYLLVGYPNWHRPDPGLCPRCEEETETTEHALLRCPARQYARGSFPETLDLKSAWYDTTTVEMVAAFVQHTLTAYSPRFNPTRRMEAPQLRPPLLSHSLFAWVRRFLYPSPP